MSDPLFNKDWHDKQRNRQRAVKNDQSARTGYPVQGFDTSEGEITSNKRPDPDGFDTQLDWTIEAAEGVLQGLHVMILTIWKSNRDLLQLTKSTASSGTSLPRHLSLYFMTMEEERKPVNGEEEVYKAIQSMGFAECLKFLKYVRSVRNL